MNALLLSPCLCGEPLFRHRRPDGRQITCAQLAAIDRALHASGEPALHRSLDLVDQLVAQEQKASR